MLDVCALLQANAMGGMLPAAGPEMVRDDRPQKPKSADVIGHNDGPALDCANPFSTAPTPSAGTIYAGDPHPQPGVGAPGGSPPASSRCRRDAPLTADCRACPARDAPASLPYGRFCAGRLLCRQRPSFSEWQERDAIKDALEKEMSHYLIFLANAPISAGRFDVPS